MGHWKSGVARLCLLPHQVLLDPGKLSYCKDVCCTLQKWMSLNSAQLSDSGRDILSKSICHTLTYYLHQTDVNKFLETSSTNSLHLLFESCKIPTALQPENEIVFKKSMIAIRSLIQKSSSANFELTDSIHIDCSRTVLLEKVGKIMLVMMLLHLWLFWRVWTLAFCIQPTRKTIKNFSRYFN